MYATNGVSQMGMPQTMGYGNYGQQGGYSQPPAYVGTQTGGYMQQQPPQNIYGGPQIIQQQPSVQQQQPIYGMVSQQQPVTGNPNDFSHISTHTNNKDPVMVRARVFVGNLNTFRVDRNDVIRQFADYGTILGCNVCKGYAFIQFSSPNEAELCVQAMNGYTWEGSELDVRLAFTDPPKKKNTNNTTIVNSQPAPVVLQETNQGLQVVHSSQNLNAKEVFDTNRHFANEFDPVLIEPHFEGSFDDVLLCGECKFRTSNVDVFVEHKKKQCYVVQKPPKEPQAIQCFTCEDLFSSSWNLLCHMTKRHNLNLYRDPYEETEVERTDRKGPQTPSEPSEEDGLPQQNQQEQEKTNNEETTQENIQQEDNVEMEIKAEPKEEN